jgi:hypothetical protein
MRTPRSPQVELRSLEQDAVNARASQDDLREYLVYLDHTQLSEAQKFELLQNLWSIMSTFVDLAFGTDPVQQVLPSTRARTEADDPTTPPVTPAERE